MTPLSKTLCILILISTVLLVHCDDGLPDDPYAHISSAINVDLSTGYSSMNVSLARANFNNFPFEDLSGQEEKGIVFVREEEKVAVNFYGMMSDLFGSEVLTQLAESERTHLGVTALPVEKYHLQDPTVDRTDGEFMSNSLQAHYDELIEEGSPSLSDAFIAGTTLQEASLVTIQNQLDRVANNRDLRNMYAALRVATRNHLRIMFREVTDHGGSYAPLFMEQAAFQAIVSSDFEVE